MTTYLLSENVQPAAQLFAGMGSHLTAQAVLRGDIQGAVWVDNPEKPRAGLLRGSSRVFLAGAPTVPAFNKALPGLLKNELQHDLQARGTAWFTLFSEPETGWARVVDQVLEDMAPIVRLRHHYVHTLESLPAPGQLPRGFTLEQTSAGLAARQDITGIEALLEEMCSERDSVEDFLARSFGVVLLDGNNLAGWCLSEYNSGGQCEVGIATMAPYRRKGLATRMGAAFLAEARQRGLTGIGWHCYADNAGSIATARRLGFQQTAAYTGYFSYLDTSLQLAVHGNIELLDRDNPAAALPWYEQAIQRGGAPWWAYYNAGRCLALAGEREAAFERLFEAVQQGLDDVEHLENNPHLTALHQDPRWRELSAALREASPTNG